MFSITMIAVAGLASAAQPAVQEEREAAARAAAEATADARGSNAYVCKKLPPPPGSRIARGRQICKTQAEWTAMEEDAQTAMEEAQRKSFQTK